MLNGARVVSPCGTGDAWFPTEGSTLPAPSPWALQKCWQKPLAFPSPWRAALCLSRAHLISPCFLHVRAHRKPD